MSHFPLATILLLWVSLSFLCSCTEAPPNNIHTKPPISEAATQQTPRDPADVVARWRRIGLTAEIPWRRSNSPGPDYTYIAQCRGRVGTEGRSLFKTEVECEILGHLPDKATQYSVGLELWNEKYSSQGYALALQAIDQIGASPPDSIIQAFKKRKEMRYHNWEVRVDTSPRMVQVSVYFRPQ